MPSPKLPDQVRERLGIKHSGLRTEDAYLHWMRRFIYFHGKKHPREMGGREVAAFLPHLATDPLDGAVRRHHLENRLTHAAASSSAWHLPRRLNGLSAVAADECQFQAVNELPCCPVGGKKCMADRLHAG